MIQQHVLQFLTAHPEIAKQHTVVKCQLAGFVYEIDGRVVGVDLQNGPPGQPAKLVVVDGSLRFPFEEFLMLDSACASHTANLSWLVHEVPKDRLMTFADTDGEATTSLDLNLARRDAMQRATDEAERRGQIADAINDRERRESRATRASKGCLAEPRWNMGVAESWNASKQETSPQMSLAWPYPSPPSTNALVRTSLSNSLMQSKSDSQLPGLMPPKLQPPRLKYPVQPQQRHTLPAKTLSSAHSQSVLSAVPSQRTLSPSLSSQACSPASSPPGGYRSVLTSQPISTSAPVLSPSPSQRALSPSPSPAPSPPGTYRPVLIQQPFLTASLAKPEGLCWGAPGTMSSPDPVLPSVKARSDGLCWGDHSTASTASSSRRPAQMDTRSNGALFAEPSADLLVAVQERRAPFSSRERELRFERFPDDMSQGLTKSPSQLTVLSPRSELTPGIDETAVMRPPDEAAGAQVGKGFSFPTISGAIAQDAGDSKSSIGWGGGVIVEEADNYFYTGSPVTAVAQAQGVRAQLRSVCSIVDDMHQRRRSARELVSVRQWPVALRLVRSLRTLLTQVTLRAWRALLLEDPLRRHVVSSPMRRLDEVQRDDLLQHLREKHAELATQTAAIQVEGAEIGARLASAEEVLSNSTAFLASYDLASPTSAVFLPAHFKAQVAIQSLLHDVDPATRSLPRLQQRP